MEVPAYKCRKTYKFCGKNAFPIPNLHLPLCDSF